MQYFCTELGQNGQNDLEPNVLILGSSRRVTLEETTIDMSNIKKKDQKRKAVLEARKWCETLAFQTQWCARKRGLAMSPALEKRIGEEQALYCAAGLAEDMLTLKGALEGLLSEQETMALASAGALTQSVVAYCLGLVPECPVVEEESPCRLPLQLPLHVELFLADEKRNAASEWLSAHGHSMSTFLGQPMLRLSKMRVVLRRAV